MRERMKRKTSESEDKLFFRENKYKKMSQMSPSCFELFFFYVTIFFIIGCPFSLSAQTIDLKGLASTWAVISKEKSLNSQFGFRWLPALSFQRPLGGKKFIEAEFSFNTWAGAILSSRDFTTDGQIKLYRALGRYSSSRFEARIGLQKISFGSATLLRPLMWFDRLDPRDPLQITEGVYALLLRYYFLSNTNIWFWTLYGNARPKGWEILPTMKRRPEFGGRLQIPLSKGEFGFSYHYRQANLDQQNVASKTLTSLSFGNSKSDSSQTFVTENRLGLDGKWDLGPGLWFEANFIWQKDSILDWSRQRAFTLGFDYTFGLGHGLYALAEYYEMSFGKDTWSGGEKTRFLAFSLSYPMSLLDNLQAIVFSDVQNRDTYIFFRWQRSYDRWNFHLMAFWNPEYFRLYQSDSGAANLLSGKGLQFMVVFHY